MSLENPEHVAVAIVGSGMAGLACARALTDAGLQTAIIDKGRGVGGRLATRRVESFQFDHGAQYVTAKTPGFAQVLSEMKTANTAADWPIHGTGVRTVGTPGMASLAKYLATGLDLRQGLQVTAAVPTSAGWRIECKDSAPVIAACMVITAPAPQIGPLLAHGDSNGMHNTRLLEPLAAVAYDPCLTLMAAVEGNHAGFNTREDANDALAWIAQDSSKPGRSALNVTTWVAQAGPVFSQDHLEKEPAEIAALMVPMLCERIGASPTQVVYSAAHRWRYARVRTPLGQPFLASSDQRLYLGGDWCLGARVEAAWQSGVAIAQDILLHSQAHH
jgi:predicted NAD/FAD-dependent oxidoreductase